MFFVGFWHGFCCKGSAKDENRWTPKSRNLELHLTMSVFSLAASLDFDLDWRALPSFPVLANTCSGKIRLVQSVQVHVKSSLQGVVGGGNPSRGETQRFKICQNGAHGRCKWMPTFVKFNTKRGL